MQIPAGGVWTTGMVHLESAAHPASCPAMIGPTTRLGGVFLKCVTAGRRGHDPYQPGPITGRCGPVPATASDPLPLEGSLPPSPVGCGVQRCTEDLPPRSWLLCLLQPVLLPQFRPHLYGKKPLTCPQVPSLLWPHNQQLRLEPARDLQCPGGRQAQGVH